MAGEFYIAPNTEIYLLKNVPLDPTYEHTIYFETVTQQSSHFITFYEDAKHAQNLTYQRVPITGKATIRLAINTATDYQALYGYNYMMFNNHSFEDKWFYAFILDIRYINNNAYEVDIQLDQMQTWAFDYEVKTSFVEREIPSEDNIGDNLVPENLETGDYIYRMLTRDALINRGVSDIDSNNWVIAVFSTIKTVSHSTYTWSMKTVQIGESYIAARVQYKTSSSQAGWSDYVPDVPFVQVDAPSKWISSRQYEQEHSNWVSARVTSTPTKVAKLTTENARYFTATPSFVLTNKDVNGKIVNGVYTGLNVDFFSTANEVNEWIHEATVQDMADGIVSIVMIPAFCASDIIGTTVTNFSALKEITEDTDGNPITRKSYFVDADTTTTYTPVNKKLFTAPYMTMVVSAHDGNTAQYPFEYFKDPTHIKFNLRGNVSCNPTLALVPYEYKYTTGENKNETMFVGNLPQCAYNIDSYQAWLAQNRYQLALDYTSGAINTVAKIANVVANPSVGSVTGLGQSAVGIGRTLATQYEHSLRPPFARGSNNGSLAIPLNAVGFQIYCASIRPEYAEKIDKYFSMYGYALKETKVPNRNVRKRWTYTKTIGANIFPTNGVPASAIEEIKTIYDNGITFWRYYTGFDVGNYNFRDNGII